MQPATLLPKSSPFARNHLLRDAVSQAIYECMSDDPSIYLYGEGAWVKQYYDAPRIYKDYQSRIVTMPISEDGNLNFAVGASLLGVKPIVNVISGDFLYRAMDSIVNNAAKLNFTGGEHTLVIQAEFLLGGPTTGQRNESLFCHVPGLRVVMPSTPRDAYGLMRSVLAEPGVTLFLEDRMVQDDGPWEVEDLELSGRLSVGDCRVRTNRQDIKITNITVLTYGVMRQVVARAVVQSPVLCTVIDLCSLYPLDWRVIEESVVRTRKVLIVEPDIVYGGIGAELAATLHETITHVKVRRLGVPRITAPASQALHHKLLPTEEDVIKAIQAMSDGIA